MGWVGAGQLYPKSKSASNSTRVNTQKPISPNPNMQPPNRPTPNSRGGKNRTDPLTRPWTDPLLTCETRTVEKMDLSWVCLCRPVKKQVGFGFEPSNPMSRFPFNT